MSTAEKISVQTDDGWTLRGAIHHPTKATGYTVVATHAMWVDRRTLDRPRGEGLVSRLADAGIRVLAFDLRGHGESGPHADEGATFDYDHYVRYDLPACVGAARARYPNDSVICLGHSLGGHAAMIAAGLCPEDAPDAIVAIAANLWLPRFDSKLATRLAKDLALSAWDLSAQLLGFFDARRLGLGHWGMPTAYTEHFREMYTRNRLGPRGAGAEYERGLERVCIPIYSLASEGDPWMASPRNVDAFLALMPRATITRRVMRKQRGRFAPNHMQLVLDPRCRAEWDGIAAWVKRLPKLVV